MSGSIWNFTDNLGIPSGRFIKWSDHNLIVRNILGLDTIGNLNINSGNGDLYINNGDSSGNTNGSYTYINNNGNTCGVLINSQLGIGINNTSNMMSNIILPNNGWIGLNTTQGNNNGFLGLAGSSSLLNTTGSRVLLYGIDTLNGNSGDIQLYSGKLNGNIKAYTGNDSLKFEILNTGVVNFQPDGSTIVLNISNEITTFTNQLIVTNTIQSTSPTSGALVIDGGLGVIGNTFINGNLSVNSITGNLNFNSTRISTGYSSGALFLLGGLGIECSSSAINQYNGGALSIAGGLALGQNAILGGNIAILNSNNSIDSLSGSGIFYGGIGVNGQLNIRSNQSQQIKITPTVNGNETSLSFGYKNNYSTVGSWVIGQNIGIIGIGNFGISISGSSFITLNGNNSQIYINNTTNLLNTLNIINNSADLITFQNTQGNNNWSIGEFSQNNFQISRFSNGNLLNYILSSDQQTGNIIIYGTENSISNISGGSLTVNGGISIAKNTYIGGNIYFSGNIISNNNNDTNVISYLTITGTSKSVNLTSGSLILYGGITIQNTSDSLSITNGGSFLTAGGGSFGANVYIRNTMSSNSISSSNSYVTNNTLSNIYCINTNNINTTSVNTLSTNLLSTNVSITNLNTIYQTISSLTSINISVNNLVSTNSSITNLITNVLNSTIANLINISSTNLQVLNTTVSNILLTNGTINNINTNNITSSTITLTNIFNASYNSNTLGNLFTTNGNIGINTKNPSSLLTINGTGSTLIITTNSTTQSLFQEFHTGNSNAIIGIDGIGLTGLNPGSMILGTIADYSIIFMTNNLQAMVIDTSGNIGINNTNPIYKLDVNSTLGLRINGGISISNSEINITNTTGSINFTSDLAFSNTTRNTIIFSQAGVSKPTFLNRTLGTKLVLYPNININTLDYAIGVENGYLWNSTPGGYKLYTNNTKESLLITQDGIMTLTNTISSINSTSGSLNIIGGISISNSSNAFSITQGGCLTAAGGLSIGKDIYFGGLILNGILASATLNKMVLNSTINSVGIGSGGNLTILGGASFSKDIYIGTLLAIGNSTTILPQQPLEISTINYNINQNSGIRISTKNPISLNDNSYRYIDLRLQSDSMNNYRGSIYGTLNGGISSEYEYMSFSQDGLTNIYSQVKFQNRAISSSSSTGSVILSGGLSINCTTNSSTVTNGGALTIAGGASISGDLIIGGMIYYSNPTGASSTLSQLTLLSTNNSNNISNGSLIIVGGVSIQNTNDAISATSGYGLTVAGGVGIGYSLYVGTVGHIPTVLSNNNTTTNLVSVNFVTNNAIISNGLKAIYNSNTIGNLFTTNGNIGINTTQPNYILDVNGITKTTELLIKNTIGSGILTINVADTNGNYSNSSLTGDTIIQANNNLIIQASSGSNCSICISTNGNVGIGNNNPNYSLDITGVINIRNTIDSDSNTFGGLISNGGISISKTTNSTSITNGGALTIAGGTSIFKDLYVGGTITSTSDKNLKKNIRNIDSILNKIDNIRTIKYNNLDENDSRDFYGFIAQDFEKDFPELLSRENENAYYSLGYDRITVLLMKCIKELKEEINILKKM